MEKATEPKGQSEGYATQAKIQENMSNTPRGTEFNAEFYSGKLQPKPR